MGKETAKWVKTREEVALREELTFLFEAFSGAVRAGLRHDVATCKGIVRFIPIPFTKMCVVSIRK